DPGRAHVESLLDAAEHHLVEFVRISEELVVVELDDEGNFVRVFARARTEHAERRSHGVASALDRQLDDVCGIEVDRILRETRAGRMLDALVDGQDRNITGSSQPPRVEERLQAAQHRYGTIRIDPDAVDEIRAWQMQQIFRNRLALMLQQSLPFFS